MAELDGFSGEMDLGTARLSLRRPLEGLGPTPLPTVLIFPGGGYGLLAEHERGPEAEWVVGLGYVAAVLAYRVGPGVATLRPGRQFPPPLEDALLAVRHLREQQERLGLDGRVVVLGFSAGGHLAASVAVHGYHEAVTRVDGSVLIYPVVSMLDPIAHAGSRENLLGAPRPREVEERFSCELQVTARTPPAFLVHGGDDQPVPVEHSLAYAGALRRCGVPFELHVYPHGPHGFGMGTRDRLPQGTPVGDWPGLAAAWLSRRFG